MSLFTQSRSPARYAVNERQEPLDKVCSSQANLLDTTRDAFDRRVDSYQGARLVNIGTKADQVTEIIPTTETLTDIYAVKFGIGDMTWGLQQAAMEVEDLGLLKDKPVYRTMLYWNIGLATVDPRSLAVLHSVDLA